MKGFIDLRLMPTFTRKKNAAISCAELRVVAALCERRHSAAHAKADGISEVNPYDPTNSLQHQALNGLLTPLQFGE